MICLHYPYMVIILTNVSFYKISIDMSLHFIIKHLHMSNLKLVVLKMLKCTPIYAPKHKYAL